MFSGWRSFVRHLVLVAGLGAALASSVVSNAGDSLYLVGQARVLDNMTLEIWGQRFRLSGIAAPEPDSVQGQDGKRYLEVLVEAVTVRCEAEGPIYGAEAPGRCYVAGVDIAASLVEFGHARLLVQQSDKK